MCSGGLLYPFSRGLVPCPPWATHPHVFYVKHQDYAGHDALLDQVREKQTIQV